MKRGPLRTMELPALAALTDEAPGVVEAPAPEAPEAPEAELPLEEEVPTA